MQPLTARLRAEIRDIKDFPKKGIIFKDLTTILANPTLSTELADELLNRSEQYKPDAIAALESRGFWFGVTLASRLGVPCIPIRKLGKLPSAKISESYQLEYGEATLEIHTDAIQPGQKILIHDDLLATGGTVKAAERLINRLGGRVCGYLFIVQLLFLKGRNNLSNPELIESLVDYQ